jgi:hypothetical protein
MWQERTQLSSDLRQGDLLAGVTVMKVPTFPLVVARPLGEEPSNGDLAHVPVKCGPFLVLSQCCIIEQDGFVAVAPVHKMRIKEEDGWEPFFTTQASERYAVRAHGLDPVPGVIDPAAGFIYVADLAQQSCIATGKKNVLRDRVVARMTARGREGLRDRLALFWGRPEQADLEELQRSVE